jgi:prevent-host-death family protein
MQEVVSAADAGRNFFELLRGVRKGHTYVVTSHGRPVAKLVPPEMNKRNTGAAQAVLLKRLKSQPVAKNGRARKGWTREELYEA